jgi:hypothetical protein
LLTPFRSILNKALATEITENTENTEGEKSGHLLNFSVNSVSSAAEFLI